MHVVSNQGEFDCHSKEEIEKIIRQSAQIPYDDIWLSGEDEYPCMTITLNGSDACLHYFLNDDGDFWQSVGTCERVVSFVSGQGEPDFTPENAVITLDQAIQCMRSFYDTLQRPTCITWRSM